MRYKHLVSLMLLSFSLPLLADNITIGNFSENSLSGWQEKEFEGKTIYGLTQLDDNNVLSTSSSNAASGLFKKVDVDLTKSPVLHWSWKIKNTLKSPDERKKAGDDFAARIYVVFSDGPFFWQTKTLNYAWANQAQREEYWPNPYTNNAQMFAVRSGDNQTGQWHVENRNVLNDIQKVFGKKVTHIEAIAIMTDTDQTGATTQAWFGDIWFSDH